MPDLIPAIGYIRVSMLREEQISPETQQAAIEDWAERRGRRIVDWIPDLDMTGRDFLKRRIREAISRVEAGEAREIAVWKYSRFGRDRAGVAVNLARLEKAGGQLQSATEEIDARTATGKFTRGMLFEVAAFESDRAGETWHEAYVWRKDKGLPPLGRARFGYRRLGRMRSEIDPHRTVRDMTDKDGERYEPDPELGPVLAGMYQSHIRGNGGPVIARGLNDRGIPNTYGNLWSGRTVLDVLDSGFGAGYLRVHDDGCHACDEKGKCRNKVWVEGTHEPVITEDEWQDYRARRKLAGDIPTRHVTPVYPVSGLVRCGHCDAAMVVSGTRKDENPRFKCSRNRNYPGTCPGRPSVPLEDLLEACRLLLEEVSARIGPAMCTPSWAAAAETARGEVTRLARELEATERDLTGLAITRAQQSSAAMPPDIWERAVGELAAKRDVLEQRVAAARREAERVSADPRPVAMTVMDAWYLAPPSVLNKLLRELIRYIRVRRVAPSARDERGHFLPQETEITVVTVWTPE